MPDPSEIAARPSLAPIVVRYVTCAALLAAGAWLGVRTTREALTHRSVFAAPQLTPFSDQAEHDKRLRDVVGEFATGSSPGERVIVVKADGTVTFHPVGPLAPALTRQDAFQLALRGKSVCISTQSSGVIDAVDIDTLTYFEDTYHRTK